MTPTLRGKPIKALVMDFDGVHTDGRVWLDRHGVEQVACDRQDGHGVAMLLERYPDMHVVVLTRESGVLAKVRCAKLGIPAYTGVRDKLSTLSALCEGWGIVLQECAYIGDDVTDLKCMASVGAAFCPADAHWAVRESRAVTTLGLTQGGRGAVRAVCDLLMEAE